MQAFSKFNRGVKYLLAVIDVLSKYGWLIPLKDKTGKSVASALKTIFKERKPEKMWVDKGKEFYNKDVKDLIELYSTENEEKSSVVERWIRTMKEKMWKYFTDKNTNIYINILPDLVKDYNNTRHSSIKMTPVKASKKENELTVWRNLYPEHLEIHDINPKFSVGNQSSVYMGLLAQPFHPKLPLFSFLNQRLDHFSNHLKNLKHSYIIRLIK